MKLKDLISPKPGEEILLIARQSLIPKSGKLILYAAWFLLPFFFLYPLFRLGTWGVILFFALVISGMVLFWRLFHTWSHTLFLITDQRLIDVDQRAVFDRVVTETRFDQIEEVRYRMQGVLSMIFRYGTISVRLRGNAADVEFAHVRKPARIQELLNDLRKASHE